MTASVKPPPEFSRSFLIDLGGGGILYRAAEKLFEAHVVESAVWKSPELSGVVIVGGATFQPLLNLRSTVFAKSCCQCSAGSKGKVCEHALAVAMHFEALKGEQAVAASIEASQSAEAAKREAKRKDARGAELREAAAAKLDRIRSIRIAESGIPLRLLIMLPPNLAEAASRGGIVVKLDAAAGKQILPLGKLGRNQPYKVDDKQIGALKLVESWCGGKLSSIIQLDGWQLRQLLNRVVGEAIVYWVKQPSAPIEWTGDSLPGVTEHLGEIPKPTPSGKPTERLTNSGETPSREPIAVQEKPREISVRRSNRLRSRPNPRRIAEAKRKPLWETTKVDYPAAAAVADSMEGFDPEAIVVDGAPSYLAVRLPSTRSEVVQPLRQILKSEGFLLEPGNRKWWLRDRHKTLNFLSAHWKALREEWKAVFTDNFTSKFAETDTSDLAVQTSEENGQFVLKVALANGADETELRRALASGKNYIEGSDGQLTLLDKQSLDRLHTLEKAVSGQADRPFTPTFDKRIETQDLADVEALLDELCEGWQPPQAWQSRSRALREVGALNPAPILPEIDELLRTYQRIGVAWLWHLFRNELGGILADEMGLGKTLQALTLIECIRRERSAGGPALVVCPASLVENWLREASRFTPDLRLIKHHGTKRLREAELLKEADIIVTSYGTLRQDAELLTQIEWGVVVGDEAQHIKNRRSQNARTLTQLRADGRFLLTGTPVENSLDDLISLFSFLMPGYLQTPRGKLSAEDKAWHADRQTSRAAAYILRRTKREVAPELPEKIEKTFFCELGAKQKRFYQDTLEKTRRDIFNLEMSGANKGRVQFAAFTELLRLRQACVDPRILDEEYPAKESAKLQAFEEILNECLDSGSRLLVFSSFVTALQRLAEHLEANGHKFCYLDGQTRNRLAICDQFNDDPSIPVFLISLKAGGTGLNLTGADTVVHYDPWWNPAAEAQATDRAHRIGQTKVVTSIKLIAADTVEEKVLELQARKAEILSELFEESKAANAKVSLETIRELLD